MPKPTHATAAIESLHLINAVRKGLAGILSDPELKQVLHKINGHLNKAVNVLQAVTGTYLTNPSTDQIDDIASQFKPLTSVGGVPLDLSRAQPVVPEDLEISDDQKLIFLAKRDKLFEEFPDMDLDAIYARMKEPDGTALVRSVAKKAAIKTYRDADLNDAFLESVQDAIRAQKALEATIMTADGERGIDNDDDDLDNETGHQGAGSTDYLKNILPPPGQ